MNKDKGPWLTISINPPKLDVKIAVRTADKFGYGTHIEIKEFDSNVHDEGEMLNYFAGTDFIEWFELPL